MMLTNIVSNLAKCEVCNAQISVQHTGHTRTFVVSIMNNYMLQVVKPPSI